MKKLTKHIQISVSQKKGKQLEKLAKQVGLPVAAFIRIIVYKYLAKQSK